MKLPILGWTVDERFLMHRLRSTSIGGLAGVLLAFGLFVFYLIAVMLHAYAIDDWVAPTIKDEGEQY